MSLSQAIEAVVDSITIPDDPTPPRSAGLKFDGGKPRFDLLRFGCPRALRGVATVLGFGAKKYKAHSWRAVERGQDRYAAALERHLNEIAEHGWKSVDEESGLPHVDHLACNALFLSELMRINK